MKNSYYVENALDIGERIQLVRKKILNMTQNELADELGISREGISRIETGKVHADDSYLEKILDLSGRKLNRDWLITGRGEMLKEAMYKSLKEKRAKEDETIKNQFLHYCSLNNWEVQKDDTGYILHLPYWADNAALMVIAGCKDNIRDAVIENVDRKTFHVSNDVFKNIANSFNRRIEASGKSICNEILEEYWLKYCDENNID